MESDTSRAMREAENAASGRMDDIAGGLASRVGMHASANAVFGDAVTRDGITVIPVAKVRWGFGGGSGRGTDGSEDDGTIDAGEGSGGGGAVMASPLGYIEIADGVAEFKRIRDLGAICSVIVASAFGAWLVLRGVRGVFH
jgi:uncharacterized spore protein YtfJ